MSSVGGVREVVRKLGSVDLDELGAALDQAAKTRAEAHKPSRSQYAGATVSPFGAVVNYSGVTTPAGFARAVDLDTTQQIVSDVENALTDAIQRAGLA